MIIKIQLRGILIIALTLLLIIIGCQSAATPQPILETVVVTEIIEGTPVEVIQVVTPTPEPIGPRTLVICLGQEPDSLWIYGGNMLVAESILQAIYDGPYDSRSFAHQAVTIEKMPSLADGDAVLAPVTVSEGDTVLDAHGEVVSLEAGADPSIMLVPAGATSEQAVAYQGGEFEMDQLSVTFTLLPNLTWSDGTPLTAADSVYSFNLAADPDSDSWKYTVDRTASYEALDDLTIVWTGLPGYMDSAYYTNIWTPLPQHQLGQFTALELKESEESSRAPMGWGSYIIDEWLAGESITLHRNDRYWKGLPVFDTVIYRFVGGNGNANIASLLSGECDILDQTSGLGDQSELMLELHETRQLNATFVTGTIWEHIDFGIQLREYDDGYQMGIDRPDFFSDVRTRRAILMCMDRQALVDTIFLGQSIVIDTYLPPNHPLFNPEVRHYDFNPQAGSALLEEIGWVDDDNDPITPRVAQGITNVADGTPLSFAYETTDSPVRRQITAIIQQSLAQCGIEAVIQTYPASVWFESGPEGILGGRRFDLAEFAWETGVEPPCDLYLSTLIPGEDGASMISILTGEEVEFTSGWFGQNLPGFVNPEYDAVCNTAIQSLPGQPAYEAAHMEAQRIFADQIPMVPLFLRTKLSATRPDMCNFIMDPTAASEFWNIEEFDYGEGCSDTKELP